MRGTPQLRCGRLQQHRGTPHCSPHAHMAPRGTVRAATRTLLAAMRVRRRCCPAAARARRASGCRRRRAVLRRPQIAQPIPRAGLRVRIRAHCATVKFRTISTAPAVVMRLARWWRRRPGTVTRPLTRPPTHVAIHARTRKRGTAVTHEACVYSQRYNNNNKNTDACTYNKQTTHN